MMCIAMALWGGYDYTSVIILTKSIYIWKYLYNSLILLINNMYVYFENSEYMFSLFILAII